MGLLSKLKSTTATSSSQDKKSDGRQAGRSSNAINATNGDGNHASRDAVGRKSFADDVTGANRADMHGEVYHGDFHHHQQYNPKTGASSLTPPLTSTKPASNTSGGLFNKLKGKTSSNQVAPSGKPTASRSGSGSDAQRPLQPSAPLRGQAIRGLSVQDTIGRFCGMRDEDWTGILELADILSTSDAYSKDAAEGLRKEFKHGVPQAQERAAKLLVVLWRNTTEHFRLKIADKKFTKQLEQTIKSHNTESPVRKTLYKAIAVMAWESHGDNDLQSIVQVYHSVKPSDAPAEGISIDENDNTFNPISFSKQSSRPRHNQQFDPDRQMDQNIHRAKVAKSEAAMFSETLAYTSAETVESNDLVKEYYPKITNWQQWISNEIPWAQAESDRVHREENEVPAVNGQPGAGVVVKKPSKQEELLDLLLSANSEIIDALATYQRLHDQAQRVHREEADLRMAQERSMSETRHNAGEVALANGVKELHFGGTEEMQPVASKTSSNDDVVTPKIAHVYADDEDLDSNQVIRHNLRDDVDSLVRKPSGSSPPPLRIQSHNPYQRYSKGSQELSPMAFSPLNGALVSEPSAVEPSPLVSKNPFYSQPTYDVSGNRRATGDSMEDAGVPKAPSAKALGKLRRYSGPRSAIDTETQQRRLEDQLRQRYESNYIQDQHKRDSDPMGMPDTEQQGHRRQQSQASQQSAASLQHQAILEEYDPIR